MKNTTHTLILGRVYRSTAPFRARASSSSGEFRFTIRTGTSLVPCRENRLTYTFAFSDAYHGVTTARISREDLGTLKPVRE